MGDRTFVRFMVPKEYRKKAEAVLEDHYAYVNEPVPNWPFVTFEFEEVNYADCSEEGNLLINEGIPFDEEWEPGDDYEGGIAYHRFDENGNYLKIELGESDFSIPVFELKKARENIDELLKLIDERIIATEYPTFENQDEYRKRFLAKQLITPP